MNTEVIAMSPANTVYCFEVYILYSCVLSSSVVVCSLNVNKVVVTSVWPMHFVVRKASVNTVL